MSKEKQIYFMIQWNGNYDVKWTEEERKLNYQNLRKHIKLMQKYGIKADYFFTGLAAEHLKERAPDIIDLLADMSINHHGANRPPNPQPYQRIKGKNWEEDTKEIMNYETHKIDPKTGELDFSKVGGLKAMRRMFSRPVLSTGRFMEASILYVCKKLGCKMCAGLAENTGGSTNNAWFMGILNRPDGPFLHPNFEFLPWVLEGKGDPLKDLEKEIEELDPSQFNVVTSVMHDYDFFIGKNPLQQKKIWEAYEEVIKWFVSHPKWININLRGVLNMAIDDRERTLDKEKMKRAVQKILKIEEYLPECIELEDDYFSLADIFQSLVFSLAHYQKKGKLAPEVDVFDILGPTSYMESKVKDNEIEEKDILFTCANLAKDLIEEILSKIEIQRTGVGNIVNPAEFLYLMAQVFDNRNKKKDMGKVSLKRLPVAPKRKPSGVKERAYIQDVSALEPDPLTELQFWTFKPARYKV